MTDLARSPVALVDGHDVNGAELWRGSLAEFWTNQDAIDARAIQHIAWKLAWRHDRAFRLGGGAEPPLTLIGLGPVD